MKNDSMYNVAVWREVGLMSKAAAWGVLGLRIGAEMKTKSGATVYVARWGVEGGGCWVATVDCGAEVGAGEMLAANKGAGSIDSVKVWKWGEELDCYVDEGSTAI